MQYSKNLENALIMTAAELSARIDPASISTMTILELDYANEILKAWKRLCDGSEVAWQGLRYWGSLYVYSRDLEILGG